MLTPEQYASALAALRDGGLIVDSIKFDGKIQRVPTLDKPNSKNGAYIAYGDAPASLWWQDWASGETGTWTAKNQNQMTPAEREALTRRMAETRKEREEEQARVYAEAAKKAQSIYAAAAGCSGHSYLTDKGVKPVSGLKVSRGSILVPLYDGGGNIVSLQFIYKEGDKRFLSGGRKKGCFFPIGGKDTEKPLVICEGLATGLSLYECVGSPVLVAFDVGNLQPVAEMARAKYPDREIIIAADYDDPSEKYLDSGGVGVAKATAAALAVDASLAIPHHNGGKIDWNDLHQKMNAEVVKTQFMMREKPSGVEGADLFPDQPVPFEGYEIPGIDPAILPGNLREFVSVVAEAVQVPPELPLINALASMAIAVQGRAKVIIHGGYSEPLNIYAMAALPPGERKSAIVELCKRPLRDWEQQAFAENKDSQRDAEADRRSLEKVIEGKRNQLVRSAADARAGLMEEIRELEANLPEVPEIPRLLVDDATPEAVAALLARQGERLGMQEAEGGIFDILAGRYSNGIPNLDLFLKAWGGESVTVDRKHGEPVRLDSPLLTICISPQPDVIAGLADKPAFRGRGLLGRFLYLLPPSRVGFRNVDTAPIPETVKAEYVSKVRSAIALQPPVNIDGTTSPYELRLSPDADAMHQAFALHVEKSMRSGGELDGMQDWASKLPGNAIRLAGLLHFFAADNPAITFISAETMNTAVTIAAIMVDHAKAAFSLMGDDAPSTAAKRVLAWIKKGTREEEERFTGRECWQSLRGSFSNMGEINAAFAILEERGFIAKGTPPTSGKRGRPSQVWEINPAILGGGK